MTLVYVPERISLHRNTHAKSAHGIAQQLIIGGLDNHGPDFSVNLTVQTRMQGGVGRGEKPWPTD